MNKISEKDKKIWNYYISNFNSIKRVHKKEEISSRKSTVIPKNLKSNYCFKLDNRTKKLLYSKKFAFDAMIDLHGKTEAEAYNLTKNFVQNSFFRKLKSIIIVTGKGTNSQGKLKLKTPLWLKAKELSKFIVGFEYMPLNKGGEGALFVKLKNIDKYKL